MSVAGLEDVLRFLDELASLDSCEGELKQDYHNDTLLVAFLVFVQDEAFLRR